MNSRLTTIVRQVTDNLELNVTVDDVRMVVREYQRMVQERDEWRDKHDAVLADRNALRKAVEDRDVPTG